MSARGGLLGRKVEFVVYDDQSAPATGVRLYEKLITEEWQDGKKVIVWPETVANGKPRFPTPPWNQR